MSEIDPNATPNAIDEESTIATEIPIDSIPIDHAESTTTAASTSIEIGPEVSFKVMYLKKMFDVSLPDTSTVSELKARLSELCGVEAKHQKVMFKGVLKDDVTLRDAKIVKGSKLMMLATVVASAEALAASKSPASAAASSDRAQSGPRLVVFEPMQKEVRHAKILAKGKPDDAVAGHPVRNDSLPAAGVSSLMNHRGVKVRLTFKSYERSLWISSAENTQKLPYGAISEIKAEKLQNDEGFSLVNLVLGSESNYFLYWVPTNYVNAIKREIFGDF
jgi:hypothetical protein